MHMVSKTNEAETGKEKKLILTLWVLTCARKPIDSLVEACSIALQFSLTTARSIIAAGGSTSCMFFPEYCNLRAATEGTGY